MLVSISERSAEVITGQEVNLRVSPAGDILGQAQKGDVFEYSDTEGEWYSLVMFSGAARYVHTSLAERVEDLPTVSADEATRRRVFAALVNAENRSMKEADLQIPPSGRSAVERNVKLQRFLNDRYKLEVCHEHGVQPAHYDAITIEGVQKGWLR